MTVWDLEDAFSLECLVLPLRELAGSPNPMHHLVHLISSRMLWESFNRFLCWGAQKGYSA